ncbi:hypothetical protein AAKU55_003599 [Oxalobacteraceae bacterium GrIS 1.11]
MMHKTQRGIAMVEMLGVLLIAAILLKSVTALIDTSMEDNKAQQTALYQSQMVIAASKYLAENYTTLAVPANRGILQTLDSLALKTAGVLPPGMGESNPYGQASCLLIRPRKVDGKDVTVLDALVITAGTAAQAIPERILAFAAANAGAGGGFISTRDTSRVQGSSATWRIDATSTPSLANFSSANCSGHAMAGGSLASALFFDGPGQAADFLYRDAVPGLPELNQMNTPLALANNAVVVNGASCSVAGIAVDSERNLMSCATDNHWQRVTSWKQPVGTWLALQDTDQPGDVRMVMDKHVAFMRTNSNSPERSEQWAPLAVDNDGNLDVPQDLTVGRHIKTQFLTATQHIRANGNVQADQEVKGNTVMAQGNITSVTGDVLVNDGNVDVKKGNVLVDTGNVNVKLGDMRAEKGGAYVDHLVSSDYAAVASLQLKHRSNVGDKCHIRLPPDPKTGEIYFMYPIGTLVLDKPDNSPPVAMVCTGHDENDAVFVYVDGGSTRK